MELATVHLAVLTHAWITARLAGCCFGEVRRPVKNLLLPLVDIMQDSKWYLFIFSFWVRCVCVCVCLCVYFFLSPSAQALELQLTKKEKKQTNTHLRDRQEPSKNKKDFAPALPSAFRSEQCQASCSKALNPSPPPPDGRSWKMGLENETEPLFRIPLMAESSSALSKHIRLHVGRNLSNCRTDSFSRWTSHFPGEVGLRISFVLCLTGGGGRGVEGTVPPWGDLAFPSEFLPLPPGVRRSFTVELRKFSQLYHVVQRSSFAETWWAERVWVNSFMRLI